MRVCIIGWYGTETIGDRAILDGIFRIMGRLDTLDVQLGSLYPPLTERTLLQDGAIFAAGAPKINITIFDSRNQKALAENVKNCDWCVMGGGPIMDIRELAVILFAFKQAKKSHKKTIVFGCGLGPLTVRKYVAAVRELFVYSDRIIFRDSTAVTTCEELYGGRFTDKISFLPDPAIVSAGGVLAARTEEPLKEKTLAVNFRDFVGAGYNEGYRISVDDLVALIDRAASLYERVLLIPMHTFFIGGDDRKFLTEIFFRVNKSNVVVLQRPLDIYETFSLFYRAKACIGMRYHSVVFQALLNGNNYILDYTNKENGKIVSFLRDMDKDNFYRNRYLSLSDPDGKLDRDKVFEALESGKRFEYSREIYEDTVGAYVDLFKGI